MNNHEMAALIHSLEGDKDKLFNELYQNTWNTAYYYMLKRLGNESDTLDAVQEVFLEVYRLLDTQYQPEAFNRLLCKILTKIYDRLTRGKTIKMVDAEDFDEICEESSDEFLPQAALDKKETRAAVAKLVGTLPDKQREAILLYYYQGLSQTEICEVTESTLTAVNNRLVKARKTLREQADGLLKKGEISYTMAAVPILAQIMLEETKAVATPAIGNTIWKGIAKKLGLPAKIRLKSKSANSGGFSNALLGTVLVMSVISAALSGISIYKSYNPAIPPAESIVTSEDIIAEFKRVSGPQQFDEFIIKHGFEFVCRNLVNGEDEYIIYLLQNTENMLYVGIAGDTGFNTAYEITTVQNHFEQEDVKPWFDRNMLQ